MSDPKDYHRALSVIVHDGRPSAAALAEETIELNELAIAAEMDVLATQTSKVRTPKAATYIGSGAVEKIRELADAYDARHIIFGRDLTATQTRNLEKHLERPVTDRSELILSIFARRAVTHEGKLQVELARSRRQMGRLAGLWTHLERQRGGIGIRGGPGEKQIELDRRMLTAKMQKLEKKLKQVMQRGDSTRARRRKNGMITAALVGYTNAGKSSLFNLLAGESQQANDRLFDTLDTTARRISTGDGQLLVLSDTVGFIRNLPHELVAGFRATLRDTADSDVLLLVSDISRPDWRERLDLVEKQLSDIGADGKQKIVVFNKIDRAGLSAKLSHCGTMPSVFISCQTQEGLPLLRQVLANAISQPALTPTEIPTETPTEL